MNGCAEWGHNRDGEGLKQINVAMMTDAEGVLMMFRMLPSIADMAVLRELVDDMRRLGCKDERLDIGRGFESAANVRTLLDAGIPFVMPSNVKAEAVKKLVTHAIWDLKAPSTYRMHEGAPYKTAEYGLGVVERDGRCEYVLGTDERFEEARKLTAFVVYGPKKAADDIGSMMSAVAEAEAGLEGTRPRDPDKAYRELPAFVGRYLNYTVEDGVMHLTRRQNAFSFADDRAGTFVMFASADTDWERCRPTTSETGWRRRSTCTRTTWTPAG